MEYNDITERLKRLRSSLKGLIDDNVDEHLKIKVHRTNYSNYTSVEFGNSDVYDLQNKVNLVLYNLASLKDNLKNHLTNI